MIRRLLAGAALIGAISTNAVVVSPAAADPGGDTGADPSANASPAPESIAGSAAPNFAAPGETVAVEGTGWPATTQVQAVVCGDLAIGGSATCAQQSSVLGYVNDDGLTFLNLVVAAPPRPCPCVIRLSSFNGPVVAVDIPFVVSGHPVGTPPNAVLPSPLLTVTEVELQGDTGIAAWFGASPTKRLVITVRNDGDAVAVNPELAVGVGKATDLEPQPVEIDEISVDPGQSTTLSVEVSLPFAAFGDYGIVGQVGSSTVGDFETDWASYPWGLVLLNVFGALLLAWAIRRRLEARRAGRLADQAGVEGVALGATPGLDRPYVLPDVVYVSELGGFLVSPKMAGRSGLLKRVTGRLELQDLAGLGAVSVAGTPMLRLPADDSSAAAVDAAIIDITALETHLARQRSTSTSRPTALAKADSGLALLMATGVGRRRAAPRGPAGRARRTSLRTPRVAEGTADAVVDLAAADAWLSRTLHRRPI